MSENSKSDQPRAADSAASTDTTATAEPRRRILALPEGSIGLLLLVLFAALFGGLMANYWPLLVGGDMQVSEDRMKALETRVGQLATGKAGTAASGVYDELRRNLANLSDRLAAGESRLTALEKAQPAAAPPAPGQPVLPVPTAPLRGNLDAVAATVAQLSDRLARLERSGASAEQISTFTDTIAKLQARVVALDADIARFSATQQGTMDAVNGRLAKIEAALPPNLAARLDELAPKADVIAADARIARLETQNAGDTLHRAAAILALANLSGAATEGRPYTIELDALAAAQPGDPAVEVLRPFARTGVPTVAMLRARFPAAARAALDVSRNAMAADFFSRLWTNIEGLISVRRVGEVSGTDPESRLARAQVRVTAGDLAGAVAEAGALRPPSSLPLAPWLSDARNRVALDRTIAQMNARIVRALATAPATPAPAPSQPGPAPVPAPKPSPTP